MRALRAAILAAGTAFAASGAGAEPAAAPPWRLDTIAVAGAAFAGLSRDGEALVVTDLASGRLLRRGADGALVAFGPEFPHGPDVIGDPTGPYRAVRVGDALLVAQGWAPVDAAPSPVDHALVAIDETGAPRVVSDRFWNPFDFTVDDDTLYVVDAAANSIERLGTDGSDQATLFTFQRLAQSSGEMRSLSPTEFSGEGTYETDAVPTGIGLRAGRLYVSLFGGFPFLAGAGRIVSLPLDAASPSPSVEFEGLNAPVAVAFDADGQLLAVEHGLFDHASGFRPDTGRLLSLDKATGDREVLLDGLTRPTSVLVWDEATIVVSDLAGNLHFLTRRPPGAP